MKSKLTLEDKELICELIRQEQQDTKLILIEKLPIFVKQYIKYLDEVRKRVAKL